MVRTTDHPLSKKGRNQAEALRNLLQIELDKAHAGNANPSVAQMLQPGMVMASPLGRALQTAVIAYGPLQDKAESVRQTELVLAPNCKEKQNFGGLDTVCTKMGEEILATSLDELKSLYSDLEKDKFIVNSFQQMRFDLEEVLDRWWPDGQAESTAQLKARLQEFMFQLLFSSQESVVVFGHSLFFQQLMREFLSDDV
ncbi:EXD3, partial [Symbiodinium pilosum]